MRQGGLIMPQLKYVYILSSNDGFFVGTTIDPEFVLREFKKIDPASEFQVLSVMGSREASKAYKFLKRMKRVDFMYWKKQPKTLQSQWLCKAGGLSNFMGNDYSGMYNDKCN
jgi:hypothetical protein